jgi:hypothetical protein
VQAANTRSPAPSKAPTFRRATALNNDFKVALPVFLAAIRYTPDEVWSTFMKNRHGREKHTELGWMKVLDAHRGER